MSEPVTNAEIEDVLSSIRRLVSEDVRNTIRQHTETPEEPPTDRLVLTPSLRVADDVPEAESEPVEEAALHADAEAEPDWAEDTEQAQEAETHGDNASAQAPWTDPEATLYEAAGEHVEHAEHAEHDSFDDVHAEDFAEPEHAEPDHAEPADAWQADDAVETDWDAEEPVADLSHDAETEDDDSGAEDATLELTAEWQDDARSEEDMPEAESDEPGLAGAVEALSAAMDGAEADDWEPHGDETADLSVPETEPMEWRDEPQDMAEPEPIEMAPIDSDEGSEEASEEAGPNLLPEDETILDEATLRELVTDIVREELQGALGERITRNVRKLVRREINRALSVQDLE